jgi:hypothetical protein
MALSPKEREAAMRFMSVMVRTAESLDAAIDNLMQAGFSKAEAESTVKAVNAEIVKQETEEELKGLTKDLEDAFLECGQDLVEGNFIPKEILSIELTISYTKDEKTLVDGQVIPGGDWYIFRAIADVKGIEKHVTLKRHAKTSTGAGKGNGNKIPLPQEYIDRGITSWPKYWDETYPDDSREGKSVPRELRRKEDKVFLSQEATSQEKGAAGASK